MARELGRWPIGKCSSSAPGSTPGQEAAFEAFEREAARIMAKHRGRIDSAVRVTHQEGAGPRDTTSSELHVVSFPDREAAEAYAADPEAVALKLRRDKIIAQTMVMAGREVGAS
ncbi:MAG: DUF1330 domain-containing protein [Hyphomonadaceae bacterium]